MAASKKLLRCGRLFDGTGADPIEGATIVVEGERIARIVRGDGAVDAGDAEVIDLRDHFVMPGLIDAHSHASINPECGDQIGQLRRPAQESILYGARNLRRDLRSGTTTMRLMAEENFIDVTLRQAIEAGVIPGPRLLICGRGITAFNGHGRAGSHFDGPDEIRRGARENLYRGADFIKIFATGGVSSTGTGLDYSVYSREEIRTAVEEAKRVGTYVAAHAHGGLGLRLCLEEGVQSIEHGALATAEDIASMKEKGANLCITSAIKFHPTGIEQGDAHNPAIMAKLYASREVAHDNLSHAVKSGVTYAIGTDSMHGLMPFELEMLVRYGASPQEALIAATRTGAEVCRVADSRGTLEAGKLADIIAVRGNPLQDITAMRDVTLVLKGGEHFETISAL